MSGPRLDELDRRLLVALQGDGRASWTAVAERCGTSEPTAARRAQQLIDSGLLAITVMQELGGDGPVESYTVRVRCRPNRTLDVGRQLVDRPETRHVALVTGDADVITEVIVPRTPGALAHILLSLQAIDGVESLDSDLRLHVYKIATDWGRQLFGEHEDEDEAAPTQCEPGHLDDVDRGILGELQKDGRASFAALADRLQLNESTVRRRFERMRDRRCFRVVTLIAADALGLETEMLLWVTVAPDRLESVARELVGHPSVRYLSLELDGNSLMCEVIATSTEALHEFVTGTLGAMPGVQGWRANVEMLTMKRSFVETPWWRNVAGVVD